MTNELRFHLDWKEYFTAERYMLSYYGILSPERAAAIIFAIGALTFYFLNMPLVICGVILFASVFFFCTPFYRGLGLRQRWRREPILRAEHFVSFNQLGVHYLLNGIESNLDWKFYQTWMETPDAFLLIYRKDVFNMIPKRALENEAQLDELRELLSSKLNKQ